MILLTALACTGGVPVGGTPDHDGISTDPAPTPQTSDQIESTMVPNCSDPVDVVVAVGPNADIDLMLSSLAGWFDLVAGAGLNARLGVLDATSTSTSGMTWMDETTVDPAVVLAAADTYEQGEAQLLGRIFEALDGEVRQGGQLSVVGWLGAESLPSAMNDAEFADWFAAVGPDTSTLWVAGPSEAVGPLESVAALTGGDIGDPGTALFDEAVLQAIQSTREFTLERVPEPGSIEVEVRMSSGPVVSFEEDVDWTFDDVRNSLQFVEFLPGCGDEVTVTYVPVE